MATKEDQRRTDAWRACSLETLRAAQRLYEVGNFRGCINRAYYAVYQAATCSSILHGDSARFPAGWNNPSHEQLPELIRNNGTVPIETRRRISQMLRAMRHLREDADYRPGITVDRTGALGCLHSAGNILELLDIVEEKNE